ncbi:hypothetical protein JNK13_07540 [bacterium]|nr:hypothetical protein [bacterium]
MLSLKEIGLPDLETMQLWLSQSYQSLTSSFKQLDSSLAIFVFGLATVIAVFLIIQRWFWLLIFFVGGLIACGAMIISAMNFQILGVVVFFIVMLLCWIIRSLIAIDRPHRDTHFS